MLLSRWVGSLWNYFQEQRHASTVYCHFASICQRTLSCRMLAAALQPEVGSFRADFVIFSPSPPFKHPENRLYLHLSRSRWISFLSLYLAPSGPKLSRAPVGSPSDRYFQQPYFSQERLKTIFWGLGWHEYAGWPPQISFDSRCTLRGFWKLRTGCFDRILGSTLICFCLGWESTSWHGSAHSLSPGCLSPRGYDPIAGLYHSLHSKCLDHGATRLAHRLILQSWLRGLNHHL